MAIKSEPTSEPEWRYRLFSDPKTWEESVDSFLNDKDRPDGIHHIQTAIYGPGLHVWARGGKSSKRYKLKSLPWKDGTTLEGYFRDGNATIAGWTAEAKPLTVWLIQRSE